MLKFNKQIINKTKIIFGLTFGNKCIPSVNLIDKRIHRQTHNHSLFKTLTSVGNGTAQCEAVCGLISAKKSILENGALATCIRPYTTLVASKKKKMSKLTDVERKEKLQPLLNAGWSMVKDRDAIYKEYIFGDFNKAFSFMSGVALLAEKMDHHPEWFNVYNKVQVTMATHTVNGVSTNDIKMAQYMEEQAKRFL